MSGYLETCRGCGMQLHIRFDSAGGRLVEMRPPCQCPGWADQVPSRLAAAADLPLRPRGSVELGGARARRWGGGGRRRAQRDARVVELLQGNLLTCAEVGQQVGLGAGQVANIARQHGIDVSDPWRVRRARTAAAALTPRTGGA